MRKVLASAVRILSSLQLIPAQWKLHFSISGKELYFCDVSFIIFLLQILGSYNWYYMTLFMSIALYRFPCELSASYENLVFTSTSSTCKKMLTDIVVGRKLATHVWRFVRYFCKAFQVRWTSYCRKVLRTNPITDIVWTVVTHRILFLM